MYLDRVIKITITSFILLLGSLVPFLISPIVSGDPITDEATFYFKNALDLEGNIEYDSIFGMSVLVSQDPPINENDSEYPPDLFKGFELNYEEWLNWFTTSWIFYLLNESLFDGYSDLFYPPTLGYILTACGLIVIVFAGVDWRPSLVVYRPLRVLGEAPLLMYVLHLALNSGTDLVLFNALLTHIADQGWVDQAFIDAHTAAGEPGGYLAPGDVVLAISASGETPFALGSFEIAHEVGARTIALTCDRGSSLAEAAEIAITPVVGAEVIAGSTRMKGGLAQKMLLHLLSTTVMVRLGYVAGNLMANLNPSSEKLRRRAVRIVMSLGPTDEERAKALLRACEGDVNAAVARARRSGS